MKDLVRKHKVFGSLKRVYQKREEWVVGYLFLLPAVLGLFIFYIYPIFMAFYVSTYEWGVMGPKNFVGVNHYIKIFSDPLWWKSLKNTVQYTAGFVSFAFFGALSLALLVKQKIRGMNIFRAVYFLPAIGSVVVVSIIWRFIFADKFGIINSFLRIFGLTPISFLGSPSNAMPSVITVATWQTMGFYMVILFAALQDIPVTYYEAAKIDGATRWEMFLYITLPLLKPAILFVLVILVITSFQVFGLVYVLTRGGPAYATYVVVYYIWEKAFKHLKFGYSAAISLTLFFIIFILTFFQLKVLRGGKFD